MPELGEILLGEIEQEIALSESASMSGSFMSVNTSIQELESERYRSALMHLQRKLSVQQVTLAVEITEVALVDQHQVPLLSLLHEAGVRVIVDDFGTGYTSLSMLRHFPVWALKVDRSFVSNLADSDSARAIVRSIVDLGHHLDYRVIAEGVETRDQEALLAEFGCDMAQGFRYGKPRRLTEALRTSHGGDDAHPYP